MNIWRCSVASLVYVSFVTAHLECKLTHPVALFFADSPQRATFPLTSQMMSLSSFILWLLSNLAAFSNVTVHFPHLPFPYVYIEGTSGRLHM